MKAPKLTVCKANEVVEAGYRLSLNEQRVVLACIAQVNSAAALLETDLFELSAKDFAGIFSVSERNAYDALIEVAENLFNRYVVIEKPDPKRPRIKLLKMRWISSIRYLSDEGKVILRFSQDMLPYLSELKREFTRYELADVGKMTSIYAIRLYELLMQWQSTGNREVAIDWLKEHFEIADQYTDMSDFKKRVLDPAVNDINVHSNLQVSWTQRKTGRRVTHLVFSFGKKDAEDSPKPAPRLREPMRYGVKLSEIEKAARPGESVEQVAARLLQAKKAKKQDG
ncbi:replication initiation protein [Methylovulum psychrotolerans]|uniref:Replication initiation protein n=1 Tax=Methylovulum psychrotolerans TaxID=1704499 RepID=A0A2S5CGC5_9GAMM|nr:replication initiation protein [Methylovulum psychrotolerans]POZ49817.1 replication initiation protein [Methylovulum psychrotolerans]